MSFAFIRCEDSSDHCAVVDHCAAVAGNSSNVSREGATQENQGTMADLEYDRSSPFLRKIISRNRSRDV